MGIVSGNFADLSSVYRGHLGCVIKRRIIAGRKLGRISSPFSRVPSKQIIDHMGGAVAECHCQYIDHKYVNQQKDTGPMAFGSPSNHRIICDAVAGIYASLSNDLLIQSFICPIFLDIKRPIQKFIPPFLLDLLSQ